MRGRSPLERYQSRPPREAGPPFLFVNDFPPTNDDPFIIRFDAPDHADALPLSDDPDETECRTPSEESRAVEVNEQNEC